MARMTRRSKELVTEKAIQDARAHPSVEAVDIKEIEGCGPGAMLNRSRQIANAALAGLALDAEAADVYAEAFANDARQRWTLKVQAIERARRDWRVILGQTSLEVVQERVRQQAESFGLRGARIEVSRYGGVTIEAG